MADGDGYATEEHAKLPGACVLEGANNLEEEEEVVRSDFCGRISAMPSIQRRRTSEQQAGPRAFCNASLRMYHVARRHSEAVPPPSPHRLPLS